MTAEVAAPEAVVFPDEELLKKFEQLRWDDLRKRLVLEVLSHWGVGQIAQLPIFAAEQLYAHLTREEQGLRVSCVPMGQGYDNMTERNKRRFAKKHMRVIGIEGMMLDNFEKMTKVDQFQLLHARLPHKYMPIHIERWFK